MNPANLVSTLLLTLLAQSDESVLLSPLLTEGVPRYVEFQETSWPVPAEGAEAGPQVRNDGIHGFLETARFDGEGGLVLELFLERVKFESKRGEQGTTWDSDLADQGTSSLRDVFEPALGQTLSFTLDSKRRIRSLAGLDEMTAAMRAGSGGGGFAEFVLTGYTPEEMRRGLVEGRFAVFPNRRVAVGDTWETEHRTPPLQGSLLKRYACRLAGLEESGGKTVATVAFTAEVVPGSEDESADQVRLANLTSSGSVRIDAAAGRVLAWDEELEMHFAADSESDGGAARARVQRSIRVWTPEEREDARYERQAPR